MNLAIFLVRWPFDLAERALGAIFPARWNPLLNLGALGFFFYWIITASGIYVYIFFDTGIHQAYSSIEYMTHDQWYAAGVMRSLHRYASDALIVVMILHLLREFSMKRFRGPRWFSWTTGVVVMVMVYVSGISGYWLVWDTLAQYVAIVTTEWLDRLPIFGEPVARNFLSPVMLDDRFFTLMIFMHIAIPLVGLAILWIHLQRVVKPNINPPRGLAVGSFVSLLGLSLVYPALSQAPADLSKVPGEVGLDWFYLPLYPLLETWPGAVTWGGGLCLLLILIAVPFLPPMRRPPAAVVDLANCNGCRRCFDDCPYEAITMVARNDDRPFEAQPDVDPSLCVACGLCAGSCPTSMPFRRRSELSPGIDLPDFTMAIIREKVDVAAIGLTGACRLMVFTCDNGLPVSKINSSDIAAVSLRCIGQLPPSFIDYVLSNDLADGVILTGCRENACHARFGLAWTKARIARERDPYLRRRVPRERIKTIWCGASGISEFTREVEQFRQALSQLPRRETTKARPTIEPLESADA